MRKKSAWIGIAAVAATVGCLPPVSLQPLHTTADTIDTNEFEGTWKGDDDDPTRMIVERTGTGEFDIVYTEKEHGARVYTGHLVKLGPAVFWDLTPVEIPEWDDHPAILTVHLVLRASVDDQTLRLEPLRKEWFEEYVDDDSSEIAVTESDDRIVLTATTERLREFLEAHAEDSGVFMSEALEYHRVARRKP